MKNAHVEAELNIKNAAGNRGNNMIIRGDEIISFLEGKTKDYKGRTFQDLLDFTDIEMEKCHDQIQWTFPLHEESDHANTYPIVDKEIIEKARLSKTIQFNLTRALERLVKFYGLGEYEDPNIQRKWCRDHNHNLLRVTRIIRCMRLFGLDAHARFFYNEAVRVGSRLGISQITLDYWDKAMHDDVWKSLK